MLRARSSQSNLESDFRVGFVRMDRGVYIGVVIAPRISDDNVFKHTPSDVNLMCNSEPPILVLRNVRKAHTDRLSVYTTTPWQWPI